MLKRHLYIFTAMLFTGVKTGTSPGYVQISNVLLIVNKYLDIKERKFAICNNTDRTVRHFVDGTERQTHKAEELT